MPTCENTNTYAGDLGLRISSIFAILIGSAFGACFPVYSARRKGFRAPAWTAWLSFAARYVGSGVIMGTAVIHLLGPAHRALEDPCLPPAFAAYSWAEGIMLMSIFAVCFTEVLCLRFSKDGHRHGATAPHFESASSISDKENGPSSPQNDSNATENSIRESELEIGGAATNSYAAQVTSVFILEFGVIFHSVFVGLTLAVSGHNFRTLYAILSLHQTLEGVAVGSRLASVPWPVKKKWTPYVLGMSFALSTPVAITLGLAVRTKLNPGSQAGLLVNGIFNSISAGVLLYTGLIELIARDFVFGQMLQAPLKEFLGAFGAMCCGAGFMAMLGKWT